MFDVWIGECAFLTTAVTMSLGHQRLLIHSGIFTWIKDLDKASDNARKYYPSSKAAYKEKVNFVSND
jgi:hypothetical protein